jgi:Holliday junction resolvasome RuvABC DNA-binding subunit
MGIENIKTVLQVVISIVEQVKSTGKPLLSIVLNLGKIVKINFKEITKEVKDIDVNERAELIEWFIELGFKKAIAEKALKNIESEKRTTLLNLAKDLLKTR